MNKEIICKSLSKLINFLPNKVFGTETDDSDIEKFMRNITKIAVTVASITLIIFVIALIPSWASENVAISELGPIGDFFGGMLNPIFAFLGLMALLYTLRLNQKELTQATEQMAKSAKAAELQIKQDEFQQLLNHQVSLIEQKLTEPLIVKSQGVEEETNLYSISATIFTNSVSGKSIPSKMPLNFVLSTFINELSNLETLCTNHQVFTKSNMTSSFYAFKYGETVNHLIKNEYLFVMLEARDLVHLLKYCEFAEESALINKQHKEQIHSNKNNIEALLSVVTQAES